MTLFFQCGSFDVWRKLRELRSATLDMESRKANISSFVLRGGSEVCLGNPKTPRSTMRAEKFCSRRSQKVSVPTVNSISNDKHTGTGQEKGRKTAHRQDSQAVEVCHGEVLEAKLRGFEAEGEKSQPQVGGVYTRVDIERRG